MAIPAHKVAQDLLKQNPLRHLLSIAVLYRVGATVPTEAIPELIRDLNKAREDVIRAVNINVDTAIGSLKRQQAKAERDEKIK